MNQEQFLVALRAFCRIRPFRPFMIEFSSGERLKVPHPEAVSDFGELIVFRGPDRTHQLIAPASVCRFLELPIE